MTEETKPVLFSDSVGTVLTIRARLLENTNTRTSFSFTVELKRKTNVCLLSCSNLFGHAFQTLMGSIPFTEKTRSFTSGVSSWVALVGYLSEELVFKQEFFQQI